MRIHLSNFISSKIGYAIKYKGLHYEAIVTKNKIKSKGESTMQ